VTEQKKKNELFWLKKFRDRAKFEFDIVNSNQENPDFLIHYDSRIIGVEITELSIDQQANMQHDAPELRNHNKGSKLRELESIKHQIVAYSQERYFEKGHNPVNATFLFENSEKMLTKVNRRELGQHVADALGQLQLANLESCRLDRKTDPAIPRPIFAIHVRELPEHLEPRWTFTNAGWSRRLQPDDVRIVLNQKNMRIDEYRLKAKENWLLIVADGFHPSGRFKPPENNHKSWPESKFERTYFLCEPDRVLFRLPENR